MARRTPNLKPLTDAQRALVEAYADWAISGAKKYYALGNRYAGGSRFTLDELTSAAYWGLVQAARLFDPARGFTFKTYAFNWCEHALKREWQLSQRQMHGYRWAQKSDDGYGMVKVAQRTEWPRDRETGEERDLPAPTVDQVALDRIADLRRMAMAACRDDRDRVILVARLAGQTYLQVAATIGFSRGLVYLRERAIFRRARLLATGLAASDPRVRRADSTYTQRSRS